MASTVRIKTHGNSTLEGIELENFSTEDTLVAILEQIKSFADSVNSTSQKDEKSTKTHQTKLEKWMQSLFGGAIGGEVATGLGGLTPDVVALSASFALVSVGLKIFQGTLNLISRTVTSVFWVAGSLIGTFISGKVAMSDYFDAIANGTKSLPIIETFTSLLAAGSKTLQTWHQTLMNLTTAGANFNGSMIDLIFGATTAGLSVEEYSKIILENSEKLAHFGTVMDGIRVFTNVANISMNRYSSQLADMGITLAQYNDELPTILNLIAGSTTKTRVGNEQLAASAFGLITEFDAMAQLTGKTRKQQEDELERANADTAWQKKLAGLNEEQRTKAQIALNRYQTLFGDSAGTVFKSISTLGIVPKSLGAFASTIPNMQRDMMNTSDAITKNIPNFVDVLNDSTINLNGGYQKASDGLQTIIAAGEYGYNDVGKMFADSMLTFQTHQKAFIVNGQYNEQAFREALARAEQERKASEAMESFTNLIIQLRSTFYDKVIVPFVENITPTITIIVNELSKNIGSFQGITTLVIGLVDDFSKWLSTADLKGDIDAFIITIKTVVGATIEIVKFIWDVSKQYADHWKLIAANLVGIAAYLAIGSGIGLGLVFYTFVSSLTGLTAAVNAATLAIGESSVGGGVATVAKGVGQTAIAATTADGLAVVAGGEAATGIGLPIAGLTLLAAGGVALWAYFANKKAEDQQKKQEDDEKTKKDNDNQETLNKLNDALMKLHELQQENNRHLLSIADNTGSSAKSGRKTLAALY